MLRSLAFCDGKTRIAICPYDYYTTEGYDVVKQMVALLCGCTFYKLVVSESFAVSEPLCQVIAMIYY